MAGDEPVPVTVRLPRTLVQVVGGERNIEAAGVTVAEALADVVCRRPELAVHLFDESGQWRLNVLGVTDGVYRGRGESLDVPVAPGTEIAIVQAMSGG